MKLLIITVLPLLCGSCDSNRKLSANEVYTLFSGKTVTGYHEKKHYEFVSYHGSSTIRSYRDGGDVPVQGNWWVNSADDLCIHWRERRDDLCRAIFTDNRGNYWKALLKDEGKQIRIISYSGFIEGNPNGL